MKTRKNVFWAIPLIFIGALWQARNMEWISGDIFHIFISWQILLIYLGIWSLFGRQYIKGLISIGVGVIFLLPVLGVVNSYDARIYWPLAFIICGILILLKPLFRKCHSHNSYFSRGREEFSQLGESPEAISNSTVTDGYIEVENKFGSVRQIVLEPVFKGASIRNTFGGVVLDLRRTTLADPQTFIDIDCTFGGIEIYLPSTWDLQPRLVALIGGSDDKRSISRQETDTEHVLVVRGNITFGGIEFKD